MYTIYEIAPDVYRIYIFSSDIQLQFNHCLFKDDEPMLYHAGLRGMFPVLYEAVKPSSTRAICAGSASVTSKSTSAVRSTSGCRWRRTRRLSVAK